MQPLTGRTRAKYDFHQAKQVSSGFMSKMSSSMSLHQLPPSAHHQKGASHRDTLADSVVAYHFCQVCKSYPESKFIAEFRPTIPPPV